MSVGWMVGCCWLVDWLLFVCIGFIVFVGNMVSIDWGIVDG